MPELEVHHDGPRWIPVAAAVLALAAAVSGLLGNLRVTQSNSVKSDAIITATRAADTYNEYESRNIREKIYEAAVASGNARNPAPLQAIAEHERSFKAPLLAKAQALDEEARRAVERAEHLLTAHEILEIGTTLFEIAIVLVSIAALAGTRLLPLVAAIASGLGLVATAAGLAY